MKDMQIYAGDSNDSYNTKPPAKKMANNLTGGDEAETLDDFPVEPGMEHIHAIADQMEPHEHEYMHKLLRHKIQKNTQKEGIGERSTPSESGMNMEHMTELGR